MRILPPSSASHTNPLRKIVGLVVTLALVVLVLTFSVVALAIVLVAGTIAGAYLWWKTRELRRQMRDLQARHAAKEGGVAGNKIFGNETFRGEVLEGEAVRVDDSRDLK